MSPRQQDDRIRDILAAISEIQSFVEDQSSESFGDDIKTMRAVELNFIIIGEAASAIPEEFQNKHPEIPWRLMRGLRNQLVHHYFSISPQVLWDTIQQDLPPVTEDLNKLLGS